MLILRIRPTVGPRTSSAPKDVASQGRARGVEYSNSEVHGIARKLDLSGSEPDGCHL
jgi:hypothetical protein